MFLNVHEKVKAVDISRSHELLMCNRPVLQFAHCRSGEEEISVRRSARWLFTWLISGRRVALKAVFP